ncbi:putative aldouronate transport system substrate-binding protein [Paenibacillus sp. cl141a]|uniref:ABC transporter substrate-binding protein n=1 Tax=Paenibacillus sp. cl141a TaxID=1761877 RepID=UPI0008CD14FB|nr:ABC transporter substrate-binding protein [Paenibacillus sp. cl141a]SEL97558.1 putative aldouronate transport system substrate-binding protein [Paenibacillus sp. cl141a]
MRKRTRVIMGAITVFSILLASCTGSQGPKGADEAQNTGTEAIVLSEPGTYPLVQEKTTLKVMVRGNPLVENFETNGFTKWYEEKTNVHIEWEVVPEQSMQEKLNLVLASEDYPDLILGLNISPAQQMIYGSQGAFLPLNDLIEKQGPNTKKLFQDNPEIQSTITALDGNIYALPEVNECYHCSMSQKMWIYEPWLKKLNLKMPETTDELYEVLKAFKEQDPNGNGIQDEIPLSISPKSWSSSIDAFLLNSFIYNPVYGSSYKHIFIRDDKLDVAFNKPEWREGLRYMNKLYAEGLLAPESFTQDDNQLIQIGENPDTVILGASTGGHQGIFTQLLGESGRWLEYKTVPPLKGPNGVRYAALDSTGLNPGAFVITKKAKHPELALRWADGLYEREHTLRSVYGRPDQEWREAKDGEVGINGEPAVWSELKSYGTVQNIAWIQTGPSLRTNEFRLSAVAKGDDDLEVVLYNETKNKYEPYKPTDVSTVPPLFLTNEQASEVADLSKTINDYVDEMMARFVIGDADLDKDWDSYVKQLEAMNVARYLVIYQEAYDGRSK